MAYVSVDHVHPVDVIIMLQNAPDTILYRLAFSGIIIQFVYIFQNMIYETLVFVIDEEVVG